MRSVTYSKNVIILAKLNGSNHKSVNLAEVMVSPSTRRLADTPQTEFLLCKTTMYMLSIQLSGHYARS